MTDNQQADIHSEWSRDIQRIYELKLQLSITEAELIAIKERIMSNGGISDKMKLWLLNGK